MSTSLTKKPSFNKNNYLSKNELLSWINDLLKVNLTLIEQLGSGTMYCQIMDVIYPGHIQLSKVKWGAKLEYDFIHNLKILQQCFDKLQIPQAIQVNKLAKVKYQDNLEFAQWLKAYFDFNCKDKGKGYDAVKRRGNAVPYFGFCKGGVLPKTTLFYRNPNEKFSIEGFANDEQESINEDQQEQQPTGSFNNKKEFQSEMQASSNNTQQNSFFSRREGSANKEKSSSIQVPSSTGIINFFARDEGIQSKNQTPSFFKMTQSESKPKMLFSGVNKETIAQTERKQDYKSQYFDESMPRKLNFFKPDNEETDISQNSTLKNTNQNNNLTQQSLYQSASLSQSFQTNNRQINNPNSTILASQNSIFFEQNSQYNNQRNNNIFMNSNHFTNNNISTNTLNTSDKKPSFIATSILLNKLQELTQVSQTLLRKNSEEVKTQIKVGTQEEDVQEANIHVTPESKKINRNEEEEKSCFFETPVSKKLKDNFTEPIIIKNENTLQIQNNQNEATFCQTANQEGENQNQRNIENTKKEASSFNQEKTIRSQSTTQTDKMKVERIQHLISSSTSGDYSLILTQISKICQEH